MKKAAIKEIINSALERSNTEKSIWIWKEIKVRKSDELGKTVYYIKSQEENKRCFGKIPADRYSRRITPFTNEYIFIEETHELLSRDWELIAYHPSSRNCEQNMVDLK